MGFALAQEITAIRMDNTVLNIFNMFRSPTVQQTHMLVEKKKRDEPSTRKLY